MSASAAVISDTGPLSYLHRLGKLDLLLRLYGRIIVPPAVVAELDVGHRLGKDLPDVATIAWIEVRAPAASNLQGSTLWGRARPKASRSRGPCRGHC